MASNESIRQYFIITLPVKLSALASDARDCPICKEPYADSPHAERPVSVDFAAGSIAGRRTCGHIFGIDCLSASLASGEEWASQCPVCRMVWAAPEDSAVVEEDEPPPASSPSRPAATAQATSTARAPVLASASATVSATTSTSSGVRKRRYEEGPCGRGRLPDFRRSIAEMFGVKNGKSAMALTADELAEKMEEFYRKRRQASE